MTKNNEKIIWNSEINLDDYKQYFKEEGLEDISNYEKTIIAEDLNMQIFKDEKLNLDKELNGRILIIADLGLWNGRHSAYKILNHNLNSILEYNYDGYKIYYDNKDVQAYEYHHDGTNHYIFREITNEELADDLMNNIYNQKEVTQKQINKCTKSLVRYIKEIYGK